MPLGSGIIEGSRPLARFRVRVPASGANLGPGFDSLALALDLMNELEVEQTDSGLELAIEGAGQHALPQDASNLILRAALRLFRELGAKPPGLRLRSVNRIACMGTQPPGTSTLPVIACRMASTRLFCMLFT